MNFLLVCQQIFRVMETATVEDILNARYTEITSNFHVQLQHVMQDRYGHRAQRKYTDKKPTWIRNETREVRIC